MDQEIQALFSLLFMVLVFNVMLIGFAHIVGGAKWSNWVLQTEIKIIRWILGQPIIWAAQIALAIGKAIKGSKSAPRLPRGP